MKYHCFLLFITCIILVGCTSTDVAVSDSSIDTSHKPLVQDMVKSSQLEGAKVDLNSTASSASSGVSHLEISDRLVSWGHRSASRMPSDIDTIIIHSVYNPFSQADPHDLDAIVGIFEDYGVAPHYIVQRDGSVVRTVAEKDIAWHAGRSRVPDGRVNVNDFSIGIEMVNALGASYTDAQYDALALLIADLQDRYSVRYVLGHDEIKVEDPWDFDWERLDLENR